MTRPERSNRPVRVLHLRDSPWLDGPGRTIIESGRHLSPTRIEYHIGVLVARVDKYHPMVNAAVTYELPVHEILDSGGVDLAMLRQIKTLVDQLNIEILHTSDFRTRLYGLLVALMCPGLVLISTAHGWIANTKRRQVLRFLDKMLLRSCTKVIMVSQATRCLVPEWWLPPERVEILHNALVADTYGKEWTNKVRQVPLAERGAVFVNVGRLSPEKGQDLLLQAFAKVVTDFPRTSLHIAGVGPMEKSLRSLTKTLGLESHVKFRGYIENMPQLYVKADLVIQSSLTEGLPNVILEAAYLGIPVIATDVGGTREVIDHGLSGWLVEPDSVDALASAMHRYLRSPDEFVKMTSAARHRVMEKFSFSERTERMTEIYERLVKV